MAKYITAWHVSPFDSRVPHIHTQGSWHGENVGPGGPGSDGRFVEVIQ